MATIQQLQAERDLLSAKISDLTRRLRDIPPLPDFTVQPVRPLTPEEEAFANERFRLSQELAPLRDRRLAIDRLIESIAPNVPAQAEFLGPDSQNGGFAYRNQQTGNRFFSTTPPTAGQIATFESNNPGRSALLPVFPDPQPPPVPPPPSPSPPPQDQPDANENDFVFDPVTEELIPADSDRAREIRAEQDRVQNPAPAPVTRNLAVDFDVETQTFAIWDNDAGVFVQTGFESRDDAERALRELLTVEGGGVTVTPVTPGTDVRDDTAQNDEANNQQAVLDEARAQAALNKRRQQANQGDWRVKLRLAPLAEYLYKAKDPGILEPLAVTDGVIFPYTPKIDLSYRAMYDTASLTHANYNSYFYKGSMLDPVNITATFTAQDTAEANYMLAVIHFFRSATKMFYGQGPLRGAPPPLVFFTGLGEYQFSEHPCVVHQFNYSLPSDVDYIRARSIMSTGANLQARRTRTSVATTPLSYALKRLSSLGQNIEAGAENTRPAPPALGRDSPTYVPTRIDISLIVYPIQSRSQVSNKFSLEQYANGDLLRGGFW
jgi:hypothetical protein